jgi:hypothetical protein
MCEIMDNIEQVSFRALYSKYSGTQFSTHGFHRYPAQVIPHIPAFFFTKFNKKDYPVTLDPFCGTGTVLVEAMHNGRDSIGVEINPIAALISKVKTTPIEIKLLKEGLSEIEKNYLRYVQENNNDVSFENINYWFDENSINKLNALKISIQKINNIDVKNFYFVVFSSIIKKISKADPKIYVPVIPKKDSYKKKFNNVWDLFNDKSQFNIKNMSDYLNRLSNPHPKCNIINEDILNKPIIKNSVDLIITSPPYISAQKYVRSTRLEAYWLDYSKEEQININKNTIGTELLSKDHYNEIKYINIDELDNIIESIFQVNPYRAGIISKYFHDIKKTIIYLKSVLKSNGKFILIIGNSKAIHQTIETNKYIMNICKEEGFIIEKIMKDKIISKGLMTKRNQTAGNIDYEWVIQMGV